MAALYSVRFGKEGTSELINLKYKEFAFILERFIEVTLNLFFFSSLLYELGVVL